MTFSVVAFDPDRKQWGVGVASKFISVGSVVPWVEAGTGAVATQAWANISLGPNGLLLLKKMNSEEAGRKLISDDDGRDFRQLGLVDSKGNAYTYTGSKCMDYAGGITGENFAVQGNILAGREVIERMASAMESGISLCERILNALSAAEEAGGDRRGRQSAAILIAGTKDTFDERSDRIYDIRVDDHPDPIKEMRRIVKLWDLTFFPGEMVPVGEHVERIMKALKNRGYDDLDTWAFDNNYTDSIKNGEIDRRLLEFLLKGS